jgi:hypothetical protein
MAAGAAAQSAPEGATILQGGQSVALPETPQKVMFVKSDAEDPKAAIANTLITQVGLNLLTMGMGSQMMRWNPYMGEAFSQFTNLGKGLFTGKGNGTKGFEYDTLPGMTSRTTVKPDLVQLVIPLETYRPSADFQPESVEPVLLRLEPRDKDQVRLLASRQVTIQEEKKGRFDMKPKRERQEGKVDQQMIPVDVERQAGNVLRVTTREPLAVGEYALVLRGKSADGQPTRDIPLKSVSPAQPAANGMASPDMMAMAGMAPQQAPQPAPAPRKGLFGMPKMGGAPPAPQPQETTGMSGFVAWDFRVVQQ